MVRSNGGALLKEWNLTALWLDTVTGNVADSAVNVRKIAVIG
jgi:hypothetical protein